MLSVFSKKIETTQRATENIAASVLDSSSQSESLQRKADMANSAVQREERPNNTGMPDNLKTGIESLSGFSMDNVRVHYNSSKPATVQALAYTQGTDIHVAPGQEKCLPHEAWHVAQQMAGRVAPTTNINGMPVNDNAALEHDADVMGEKAVTQRKEKNGNLMKVSTLNSCSQMFFSDDLYNSGKIVLDNLNGLSKSEKKKLCKIWDFIKDTSSESNAVLNKCCDRVKVIIRYLKKYSKNKYDQRPFRKVKSLMQKYVKRMERREGYKKENAKHFRRMCNSAIRLCQNVSDEQINVFFGKKRTDAIKSLFGKTLVSMIRKNYELIALGIQIIKNEYKYANSYTQPLGTYAYVKRNQEEGKHSGRIRLATSYRAAKSKGSNSKPGIIIHETSHLVLGTGDYAYGVNPSKELARKNPSKARKNADSYEYAAEQTALVSN